jgi:hypothetical protein
MVIEGRLILPMNGLSKAEVEKSCSTIETAINKNNRVVLSKFNCNILKIDYSALMMTLIPQAVAVIFICEGTKDDFDKDNLQPNYYRLKILIKTEQCGIICLSRRK